MKVTTKVLKAMLLLLKENRLEVMKVPRGEIWIRVAYARNCEWYQQLCGNYVRRRRRYPRVRTYIKRRETIKALERMISGDRQTEYAKRIIDVVGSLKELN